MKYALIGPDYVASTGMKTVTMNIGDYMYYKGVENVYDYMGIPYDLRVVIPAENFSDYDGESVVLPFGSSFLGPFYSKDGLFHLPDKIFPVFLGVTMVEPGKRNGIENVFDYLRRFEPIGCRDDVTVSEMRAHDVRAYLGGCLSLTMPRRDPAIKGDTVYLIDIPQKLLDYMPAEVRDGARVLSHYRYLTADDARNTDVWNELCRKQYDEYREHARLVVTSRLHAALPCLAMGIPVILVRDYGAFTFSWVEKLLPLYTREHYGEIDWHPQPADIEELKEKLLRNAADRIRETYEKNHLMCEIGDYYEDRPNRLRTYEACQNIYLGDLFRELNRRWNKNQSVRYALWGLQSSSERIYQHICREFPRAELVRVFDGWFDVEFHGIRSTPPEQMTAEDDFLTIVIATNAVHAAQELFQRIQKPADQYYFVADSFLEPPRDTPSEESGELP